MEAIHIKGKTVILNAILHYIKNYNIIIQFSIFQPQCFIVRLVRER